MRSLIAVIALQAIALFASGQDNHYGWMQFGARNNILYSAGVSRFEDQSAVILNPATLTGAQASSFNFNTNVVAFNTIKFDDALGQGFTIKNSNLNVLPSMASGVFKPANPSKKWTLGYALYHANTDVIEFSDRVQEKLDLLSEAEGPGNENYLAQYNLNNKLDEFTTVAGLGWRLTDKLSFGFSQSFTMRKQESREVFSAYVITDPALNAPVDLVGSNLDYDAKYSTLFTHTKIGFTYQTDTWDLGLTISSPTLRLSGKGRILADFSLTNVRIIPGIPRRNILANGKIDDIKATYKYPVNLTLAASRLIGRVRAYGSVSWYGQQGEYTVMDPGNAEFIQPPSNDNVLVTSKLLRVWSQNKAVVNACIGADWSLKDHNHLLMSIRNDNHYGVIEPDADGINTAKKIWNNYHITIGNQRQFQKSALIVGLRYSYGINKDYPQPASFENPTEGNLLQGTRGTGTVRSTGFQLLVSYMFNIGKS